MIKTEPILFDILIKYLERYNEKYPRIYNIVKNTRLFWIPEAAHKMLPKELKKAEWLKENLYLPFPVTGIEDKGTLTILQDLEEEARGINHERLFIEVTPIGNKIVDLTGFYDNFTTNIQTDLMLVAWGVIKIREIDLDKFNYVGEVTGAILFGEGKERIYTLTQREGSVLLKNVGMTLQELCVLCDPEIFILEISPVTERNPFPKRKKWNKRIPRVKNRPIYTLMRPHEIRQCMGLETGSNKSPHERRAHTRRLMSEKFTYKKGQIIHVKSTWIGPSEKIIGNKRYKVLLDENQTISSKN